MVRESNLKKKMDQSFECKYCGTKFHKESTLQTHLCVKKRRHIDLNSSGSRFGFRTFQRFYEITANSKKLKTTDDFINSPYYIEFVKFGNHLATLRPVYLEQFIDFVIRNGVKLKDWTKDFVYDTYIEDLVKREPAVSATERTITDIMDWCEKNNSEFKYFFENVSANEAAYMIRTGRISPWVLYLCATGGDLMNRFNEDHAKMIGSIIDPGFWMKKFKKNDEDVEYIKNLLEQAGL
jgi:hypothetical protein